MASKTPPRRLQDPPRRLQEPPRASKPSLRASKMCSRHPRGKPKNIDFPWFFQCFCVPRRHWHYLASASVLKASWERLGSILGASWGHLGPSWSRLGASWDVLGRFVGVLGPSWPPKKLPRSLQEASKTPPKKPPRSFPK